MLGAAAARKQPARNASEQQVTVLRRVLKLTVKAAEAMSKGAVNFLGGTARNVPVHALANGAIVPACATRSGLSSPAAGSRASDKIVSLPCMICLSSNAQAYTCVLYGASHLASLRCVHCPEVVGHLEVLQ